MIVDQRANAILASFPVDGICRLLLTAGVLCYLLARYLSSPVVKLRAATQRLAAGDLSARVGAANGRWRDELADLGRDFDVMAERIQSLMDSQQRLLHDIFPRAALAAIENVVRNAASYTAEGTSVEVSLRCENGHQDEHAVIRVLDKGSGVPQAALANIFHPFYRGWP